MKIGITMGDPAGIGPEIILKALKTLGTQNTVIIGSNSIIEREKQKFHTDWEGEIIDCVKLESDIIKYGETSKSAGAAAYQSILEGYKLITSGKIDALVTAPICKESLALGGVKHTGHTELLAELSKTKRFAMMLVGKSLTAVPDPDGVVSGRGRQVLRVTLVTIHIPLKKVSAELTSAKILEKIELTQDFLIKYLNITQPKIGVCALNPHGGEGLFGDEEKKIIIPAIEKAKNKGILAMGPYPADTLFAKNDFDAVIAMYHDQGLIPLKLNDFDTGVNITLGLPFIRTSPCHGTAFDIAGKGIANPGSMIQAIKLARELISVK